MTRSWCALAVLWTSVGCAAAPAPGDSAAPAALPSGEMLAKQANSGAEQKIIYRATLVLHVEDFAATEVKLKELMEATGSHVAQFREDRPYGAQRGGHWTLRVPVPQFERFLDAVGRLGVAEQREIQADDVSEEFVDLEARLKNKQQLESRLLELVAKRTDEVKDVIAAEAELGRVREEIERMQGRLRYLNDRVKLTTVDVTAYERRDYRPPEATFVGRIKHTFWQSVNLLKDLAEACVLMIVGLTPWLVAFVLLMAPVVQLIRRRFKRTGPTIVVAQPV